MNDDIGLFSPTQLVYAKEFVKCPNTWFSLGRV